MNNNVITNHEKNVPIQIKKNIIPNEKKSVSNEYSLKHNLFDPFKNSPPNEFMLKLNMRYFVHTS